MAKALESQTVPAAAVAGYWAFNDLLDYVWKTPEFLELQERIELRKARGDRSSWRWKHESRKLHRVFPVLLAISNIALVVSLLELHVGVLVAHAVGAHRPRVRGGLRDLLKQLRATGLDPYSLSHWQQVDCIIRVRNCLIHSAGFIGSDKDEEWFRNMITRRLHLEPEHRRLPDDDDVHPKVVNTQLGPRLRIQNEYAWLATAYARDYFVELCGGYRYTYHEQPSNEEAR